MDAPLDFPVVDGRELPDDYRNVLHPGEIISDSAGVRHRLPRYFYQIESWQKARETNLAPTFGLYEFINTDLREARVLHRFPRYVPLAIAHMATHLSVFRQHVGTYVHIAANGGYRSPGHAISDDATPHLWGTAVNIYRIGDDFLDSPETIGRYTELIKRLLPGVWVRPYGFDVGGTVDHLHVDLGRFVLSPREKATCADGSGGSGEHEPSG
jgi:hypothetical protein